MFATRGSEDPSKEAQVGKEQVVGYLKRHWWFDVIEFYLGNKLLTQQGGVGVGILGHACVWYFANIGTKTHYSFCNKICC